MKTSLAPGSRVVTDYLRQAGLTEPLEQLGFHVVGYGCTTCIGNSGPLPDAVAEAVTEGNLVAAAVLSGNRNFEGRVNPLVKANYLASPPLVVAYALAGTVDIDLHERAAWDRMRTASDVYLARHLADATRRSSRPSTRQSVPEMFRHAVRRSVRFQRQWNAIQVTGSEICTHGMRTAPTFRSRRSWSI